MDLSDLSALLGEDASSASYADIWVSTPDEAALRLVGEARRLADGLGCYVHAVVARADLAEPAIAVGADRVHVASLPGQFLLTQYPEFAFFPLDKGHQAARVAQHHKGGLMCDARELRVDDGTRALVGATPVYEGEYWHEVALTTPAKFATLDARRLPQAYADPSRSGEIVPNDFQPSDASTQAAVRPEGASEYAAPAWRPLQKARRIVAVGRGLRDEAGLAAARQLAEKLGAELAGDRSARDMGWIDAAHEVGLNAQEVAPDLYLALGVRGDAIHNAAIAGARQVIAVHARADAPVLAAADQAVVANPAEFARALLAQLQ